MSPLVKTACIIDDDDIYIFGIKKLLQIRNLCENIIIFNNGKDAIDHFHSHSEELPNVILLDINMPVMNGWEFLNEYAKLDTQLKKNTILYMVSSSINPQDIERAAKEPEVHQYLIKPINLNALTQIFQSYPKRDNMTSF